MRRNLHLIVNGKFIQSFADRFALEKVAYGYHKACLKRGEDAPYIEILNISTDFKETLEFE